jgi:ABC-type amino acid transport substrate-binding protein
MRYEFVAVGSFMEMLDALEVGKVDVAVAAISMAPERETRFDFS